MVEIMKIMKIKLNLKMNKQYWINLCEKCLFDGYDINKLSLVELFEYMFMLEVQIKASEDKIKDPKSSDFGFYEEIDKEIDFFEDISKKSNEQGKLVFEEINKRINNSWDTTQSEEEFFKLRSEVIDRYIIDHGL